MFPPLQRGTKGDLKSLSISLYKREKPSLRELKERGIKGVRLIVRLVEENDNSD